MQTHASITLREVPEGVDANQLAKQLAAVMQKITGRNVRVNVTDNDAPGEWDRLSVLQNLNKGIALPGSTTNLPQNRDRINLYRG